MQLHAELTAISIVVLAALGCGVVFSRLRMPPVVGYIVAGVVLGPAGLALIGGREQVGTVAELGVLLLLFTIGMQLSLRGFRAIWLVSVGTAAAQIVAAVGLMLLLGKIFGFSIGVSVVFGFVIALSSTVVAVRMLEDLNLLRTQVGQITISILIAQDLAVIPMILVIGVMAGGAWDMGGFIRIGVAVAALGGLAWYLSRRHRIHLPFSGLLARQTDLRPVYGVALCFGSAAVAGLMDLSAAYGAFVAGLVVGNSTARNVMLRSVRPIQNLLMMVFFVSIGLLVDVTFLVDNLGTVITIVLVVTVVKTLFNIGVIRLLGEPWPHAFIAGLLVAQIGEFSFLIGNTGFDLGILDAREVDLVVTVTVITLLISPVWLATARRVVRIGFTSVHSWREIIAALRAGGVRDLIRAMRKAPPSLRVAARYYGRPGTRLRRGVIAEKEIEVPPELSPGKGETGMGVEAARPTLHVVESDDDDRNRNSG